MPGFAARTADPPATEPFNQQRPGNFDAENSVNLSVGSFQGLGLLYSAGKTVQ
jgi:hypothetical protein